MPFQPSQPGQLKNKDKGSWCGSAVPIKFIISPHQQKEGNCSRKTQLIISEYRTLLLNYREGLGREISVICKPNNRGCAA